MYFPAKKQGSGSKDFIRLKDGESVVGILSGTPIDFKTHWVNNGTKICSFYTDGTCQYCEQGMSPAFRFKVNFIIQENGMYVAKILEQGWTVYEALEALNTDYDLESWAIRITRKGSDKSNTTYSVVPLPSGKLDDVKMKALKMIKLHDLGIKKEEKEEMPALSDSQEPDDVLF